MDPRLEEYTRLIKKVLQDYADYVNTALDSSRCQVVFDDQRGQYLLIEMGWSQDQYIHTTPIHISLIEEKVWIQTDDTEHGVASELVEAGIPTKDIVLGFRHPSLRPHTGFAVA